jgi:hypothetical protein
MRLRVVSLSGCTGVHDLTPLQGMPLQTLNLSRTTVDDISVVAGMPLEELNLEGCSRITDFSPLKDCPTLQKLLLPRQAKNIEFLRGRPNLKFISYKNLTQPAAEFWAERDEKKGGPSRMEGAPGVPPKPRPPKKPPVPPSAEAPVAPPADPTPPKPKD